MAAKQEFLKQWMRAETLKKAAPEAAASKRSAAPQREGAARVPSAPGAPAPEVTMELAPAPALVPFADMDYWYLSSDMTWTLPKSARTILIPRGFVTDFASVPTTFWAWMPPTGRYGLPAIVHDWLYWDQRMARSEADDVFGDALGDLDVSGWRHFVLYRSVRWFGGKYWRENTLAKQNGEGRVLKAFPNDARIRWNDWRTKPGVFG
jgi:hypothetical protein